MCKHENNDEIEIQDINIGDKLQHIEFDNIKTTNVYNEFKLKYENELECIYCNHVFARKSNLNKHVEKCKKKIKQQHNYNAKRTNHHFFFF